MTTDLYMIALKCKRSGIVHRNRAGCYRCRCNPPRDGLYEEVEVEAERVPGALPPTAAAIREHKLCQHPMCFGMDLPA